MKRLSVALALLAAFAVAGTAAASPTITGSANLTISGNTAQLTPSVGGLNFNWDNGFSAKDGDAWSLSGKLAIPQSFSLNPVTKPDTYLVMFPVQKVNEGTSEAPEYHYYATVDGRKWEITAAEAGWAITDVTDPDESAPVTNAEAVYTVGGEPVQVSAWVARSPMTGANPVHNGDVTSLKLYNWHLMVHPSIFEIHVANGVDLSGYGDDLGFVSLAANPGGNHLQVKVPVSSFTLAYDASTGGNGQQGFYAQAAKTEAIPATLKAVYKANEKRAAASAHYEWANGYVLEAGFAQRQDFADGLAYGAELTVPVTKDLQAYLVGKQIGAGFSGESNAKQPTVVKLTYTQPQYRGVFYSWQQFGVAADPQRWADLSLLLSSNDAGNYNWYYDSNWDGAYTEYRSLKGAAVYAKAIIAPSNGLQLRAASSLLNGKASGWIGVDNALAATPTIGGEFYLPLTAKLTSATSTSYQLKGTGLGDITTVLGYKLSGSSSITTTLTKPADESQLNYQVKFSVSF